MRDTTTAITLSNRSGTAADYSFSFRPEGTVTAVPGMYATEHVELLARRRCFERNGCEMTLEGGSRTAATVDVVANKTSIDVSSTLSHPKQRYGGSDGASVGYRIDYQLM